MHADRQHFVLGEAPYGPWYLSHAARRRHLAVFGKSGSGKSTFLANLAVRDLQTKAGYTRINQHMKQEQPYENGLMLIDPHGDLAEMLLDFVPKDRTNDTIYFNATDPTHSVGFNLFSNLPPEARATAAAAIVSAFAHIFQLSLEDTPRLLHYLRFSVLALLDVPGMTLAHLPRMFGSQSDPNANRFRTDVLNRVANPTVRGFWLEEFANNSERYNTEAAAPVLSRVKAFLAHPIVANIIGQRRSTFDLRTAMDERQVIIVNLAEGRLGEEATNLLGSLLITQVQLAAMSRVDTPEPERADFSVIVDEFAKFTTSSFANLLSEARKMAVNVTLAGQYRSQSSQETFAAVAGNVGALVVFRVGVEDAEYFAKEFAPVRVDVLSDLWPFYAYTKSFDHSTQLVACAPLPKPSSRRAHKVIAASRDRYARPRRRVARDVRRIMEGYA